MDKKERDLLIRCTGGEKQAWDELVGRYSALVYNAIKRTLGSDVNSQLIDDLFQDFFLALFERDFRKLRQFRGDAGCSLASWLRLIATRLTIDFMRRREIQTTHDVDSASTLSTDPSSILMRRENRKQLASLVEELPPRDRLLLKLYYSDSLKAQEISEILDISVPAVYTQKSRLLDKLRRISRQRGFDQQGTPLSRGPLEGSEARALVRNPGNHRQ